MSIVIKFRAWNNIVGRMSECYTIEELHKQEVNFMNITLMQYIGHQDKNRKEIYDGDIVKVGGLIEVVLYVKGILCCYSPKIYGEINDIKDELEENGINVSCLNYFEAYEVIGNIYENPELINKEPE